MFKSLLSKDVVLNGKYIENIENLPNSYLKD